MARYYIIALSFMVYLSNAFAVTDLNFINRTQHPIHVVYFKNHCVDDSIKGTRITIPPAGHSKGTNRTIKVMFKYNDTSGVCTGANKWVSFKATTTGIHNKKVFVGNITYEIKMFNTRTFSFSHTNQSSGIEMHGFGTSRMLFEPSD